MAPSHFGDRTAQGQGMPADGRDSEAQAPRHTANTAGANFPVPRPPDPRPHPHGTYPHYHPSSTAAYQLVYGARPNALPHGHGFNNLYPRLAQLQQAILSGAVHPAQLQTARMHQALRTPPPMTYGALGHQHVHGGPQAPYGAVGSPYAYGSPQVSYQGQQVRGNPQVPYQGQHVYGNFQTYPSRPPELQAYRPPSTNTFHPSLRQPNYQQSSAQATPPIQEWPTANLNAHTQKKQARRPKEAQGQAQRTAGEHSSEAVSQQRGNIQPTSSSVPSTSGKRKVAVGDSQPPPTLPPPLRHPAQGLRIGSASLPGDGTQYYSQYPHRAMSEYYPISQPSQQSPLYTPHLTSHGSIQNAYEQDELHTSSTNYAHDVGMYGSSHHEHSSAPLSSHISPSSQHKEMQSPAEPLPTGPIPREDVPQPITREYEDYKWPVKLYELRPDAGVDFAHAYMEDWFENNIRSSYHKWHCHTTKGFIEGGNRFSVVVLHNAADPFTWNTPSESTTSFAVYDRFSHKHEELRWTTITPSIPGLIASCANFVLKNRWDFDMPKATDKRFHRAYWLAANMMPLGKILNQHLIDEKPHDESDQAEMKEAITFTEEDLQCQWIDGPMSTEHSARVWQIILDEVDSKDVDALEFEHMTIGCKEREWETERYA